MATTRSQAKIASRSGWLRRSDRPGGLAGVLDQLARRADGVRDGAVELAVVAAVELVLVAAARRLRAWGVGRGLHEPRPG